MGVRVDVLHREFGRSLSVVGPDKPLGGRRFDNPLALLAWVIRFLLTRRRRGLDGFIEVTPTGGVWAYAWHVDGLVDVLNEHLEVQQTAGWAPEGDTLYDLVQRIRTECVALAREMAPMGTLGLTKKEWAVTLERFFEILSGVGLILKGVLPGSRARKIQAFLDQVGEQLPEAFRQYENGDFREYMAEAVGGALTSVALAAFCGVRRLKADEVPEMAKKIAMYQAKCRIAARKNILDR